ncbi:MAG TPA: sugar phosphate isomerase/epimerase family protein [Candidatus Hydrogenedentes bacterium]|nr:sugar phosphate isomerase/epimerase family protein [Candidatus Hydrogenedentota bacterium]HOM49501.1 sugar phosphate isomerase/epimerase family protein [Candidatus Hydrogenedentota bacterium]HOR51906.1 sugar phosphate isomerase/epimerase family protein [Candidatus Hydrogenedentota bacterium]HPK25895.1 sugar phosphate isomerase/epimerase family protein [Candidatus Hydrogenedentota bacterium]
MFYSGISDEAGQAIAVQIKAHQELGWNYMELRLVDGVNLTQISDAAFDDVYKAVTEADMKVSCFGSAIANWARPITCPAEIDRDDLKRAIPRMHRFHTPFIRVMSYPNEAEHPVEETAWRREAIKRMKELARIAEDNGITLVHENCSGWGGLSAENSNILLGEVDSPALKVVFDTGNPVTYGQDAWEYYKTVRKDIVYVHIKDARKIDGVDHYCLCGDGDGYVREIVGDLLKSGYDGGLSIEPHLAAVIHTGQKADNDEQLYQSYTDYGRRLMEIVAEVRA